MPDICEFKARCPGCGTQVDWESTFASTSKDRPVAVTYKIDCSSCDADDQPRRRLPLFGR